jgi:hypothetical protein
MRMIDRKRLAVNKVKADTFITCESSSNGTHFYCRTFKIGRFVIRQMSVKYWHASTQKSR